MRQTSVRAGIAGAVATVVMTLEQSLDKRLLDSTTTSRSWASW
jgi:hypothetical protein